MSAYSGVDIQNGKSLLSSQKLARFTPAGRPLRRCWIYIKGGFRLWKILLFLAIAFSAQRSLADELIWRDVLSADEDLYLVELSVRESRLVDDLAQSLVANYYFSMHSPRDYLEIFDSNSNIIGRDYIGEFRSYGFLGIFDCERRLMTAIAIRYYSSQTPSEATVVHSERLEPYLLPPRDDYEERLFSRVCEIGAN